MSLCLYTLPAQSISQKVRCKSSISARFSAVSAHLSASGQAFLCERPVYVRLLVGDSLKPLNTYLGVMTCFSRAG